VERLRPIARWRWPILLGVWLVNVPTHWTIHRGDWIYFVWGAKLLGLRGPGAGLQTLGAHPALATGPLSLVVTRFLQIGGTNGLARAQFLMWALGPAALVLLERAGRRSRPAGDRLAVDLTVLSGGAVLLQTWALAAGSAGHIDDVLTMSFAALAVWATAERRPGVLACAIALATAAKPWGLFLLPLTLAPQLRHPLRTAALALGVTALPWLPFALADHALISQHLYDHFVMPRSGLAALGMPQEMAPHWVRPAQVLGGVVLGAVVVRRVHWGAAVAAGLAVRLALDPAAYGYYTPTFVLAALVLDLVALRRPLPVATVLTVVTLEVAPALIRDDVGLARLRLADAFTLAAIALLARSDAFSSARSGRQIPCTTR